MKIKKINRCFYFPFNSISSEKTEYYYWGSCNQDSILKVMSQLADNHIIVFDEKKSRSSLMGLKFRKYLNLNKKDNDDKVYLVIVSSEKYFMSKFMKKCFYKSQTLINKKYFFIDYKTYKLFFFTGNSQEIFYLMGN